MATTFQPWLVALDIDGTVFHEDGTLSQAVIDTVQTARALGHEVTLATGRSVSMTMAFTRARDSSMSTSGPRAIGASGSQSGR